MRPADICNTFLGSEHLPLFLAEMSSPQLKGVLKSAGLRVKLPGSLVSQQKRKQTWCNRIAGAIAGGNDDAANEFVQQWLLNHRRQMLIDYLDSLDVRHNAGETDQSFLLQVDAEKAKTAATTLLTKYPPREAATYLSYIAHQQKATVFDDWEPLSRLHLRQPVTGDCHSAGADT